MRFKLSQDENFYYEVKRVDWWGWLTTSSKFFNTMEEAVKYIKSQLNPIYYP
jgi:hypothetical protein